MPEEISKTPGPWWCILLVSVPCSGLRRASLGSHHTGNDPPLRKGWSDHCKKVPRAVQWIAIIFFRWEMQGKPLDLGVLILLWGYEFHFLFVCNSVLENNKARLWIHLRWGSFIRYKAALKTIQLLHNRESVSIRFFANFPSKSVSTRTFQYQGFSLSDDDTIQKWVGLKGGIQSHAWVTLIINNLLIYNWLKSLPGFSC